RSPTARASRIRRRGAADRRRDAREVQHFSRWRRRKAEGVRDAATLKGSRYEFLVSREPFRFAKGIPDVARAFQAREAMRMRLPDVNALATDAAAGEFLRCCGSTRWARAMAAARPFPDISAIDAAADRIFDTLEPADWLEAFGAHPRIGESER